MLAAVPQPTLALPSSQVWVLILGSLVPLVTYVLNHRAGWIDERVKGLVTVVVAAVVGGLYQALEVTGIGWNGQTAQYVLSAVVAALAAHHALWKPSGVSTALGGGRNVQDNPAK